MNNSGAVGRLPPVSDAPLLLDVGDLVVRYGRKEALSGVDVRYEGGSLGLLGPNGAGKSSLLRAILGLIDPTRGRASVLGIDSRNGVQVRANAGYMPESDCHIPGLSGLEFTAYCARLAGLSSPDAKRRAHEVLVYVGLDEERYRKVDEYSTGMKQKVKFAAALVHDPSVLFLDEPTNGLDPQARHDLLELIKDLAKNKGMNIVLSSHLLRDVDAVCDDMIVLANGSVRAAGSIEALKGKKGGFVVRVSGDPGSFMSKAGEQGFEVTRDARGAIRVRFESDAAVDGRTLFEIARAAGTPLSHFAPEEESLEDLFLRAIEGAGGSE